jgi:hypothetical protein
MSLASNAQPKMFVSTSVRCDLYELFPPCNGSVRVSGALSGVQCRWKESIVVDSDSPGPRSAVRNPPRDWGLRSNSE